MMELKTLECRTQSEKLLTYCESKFDVGHGSGKILAPTGEKHVELARPWADGLDNADAARVAAQGHFDRYAEGKSGTLYWRTMPDIGFNPKSGKYSYYMRLLISDKPRIP